MAALQRCGWSKEKKFHVKKYKNNVCTDNSDRLKLPRHLSENCWTIIFNFIDSLKNLGCLIDMKLFWSLVFVLLDFGPVQLTSFMFILSYKGGFYKPTVLKVPLVGLQHMQQCQVGWNIPLSLLAPGFWSRWVVPCQRSRGFEPTTSQSWVVCLNH